MHILRSYKDIVTRNVKDKKKEFARLGEISSAISGFASRRNISLEEIRIQNERFVIAQLKWQQLEAQRRQQAEAIIQLREEKERRAREEAEREEEHLSELEPTEESVEDEFEEYDEVPDEILDIFTASEEEESIEEEEEESPEESLEVEPEEPLAAVKKRKPKKKVWFDKTYCADEDDSFCYRQSKAIDIAAAYSGDSSPPEISSFENLLLRRYPKKKVFTIEMEKKPKVPEKKVYPCSFKKIESVYPEIVIEENRVTVSANETVNVRIEEPVVSVPLTKRPSVRKVVPVTTTIQSESYKKKTPVTKQLLPHQVQPPQISKKVSDVRSATTYLHQSLGAVPYSLDPYPGYPPRPAGGAIQIQTFPSRYEYAATIHPSPSAREESALAAVLEGPKYSNPLLRESPSVQRLRYKYFFEYYIPTPSTSPGPSPKSKKESDVDVYGISQSWNLSEDPSEIKLNPNVKDTHKK